METGNWISLVSALIVAIGWLVTGYLNRRKDIAQKRLEYRLKALESFLPIFMAFQKKNDPFESPDFCSKFEQAQAYILLYGFDDEISFVNQFVDELKKKSPDFKETYSKFSSLVRTRIRNELKINA